MADTGKDKAEAGSRSIDERANNTLSSYAMPPPSLVSLPDVDRSDNSPDEAEDMELPNISDEDAESLIGVSMSEAALRLKSPKTPALEKQHALEEAGAYFERYLETPPTTEPLLSGDVEADSYSRTPTPPVTSALSSEKDILHQPLAQIEGVSLGTPPSGNPNPLAVQRPDPPQSSLHGVFGVERKRSLSGSADALRKFLPKGLPSMAQVGNFFGSSGTNYKSKLGGSSSLPKDAWNFHSGRSASSSVSTGSPTEVRTPPPAFDSIVKMGPAGPQRPAAIRRVTSDDSLLYHSISRASSLGDDARFENQREQVNSRVKAIRDSLQDRSSFRMPQMPSIPRVPSFGFNMNFLNTSNLPSRWGSDPNLLSNISPGNVTKSRPTAVPSPAIDSGMVGTALSVPQAAVETAQPLIESPHMKVFDRAIQSLTGDVVIMGGYRGSILRSTKTKRQVWVPVKVGLNIRKVDLEVGLEPEDEERMEETIYPSGMLQNIGPVDISKRLFKRLSECENARSGNLRVWDYGYDWRLSPHILSRKLTAFLEKLPSNQASENGTVRENGGALVIAHSLGGLITRHVVNQRPELFSGVIYAGVPQSCVNILGPLRNGDAVLLSSRVLTAQVNFTLRTSFVLLPEDGGCFVDINTKEKYPVDFFNLDDWIKYRLSPCTDPPLPPRAQNTGGRGSLLNLSGSILNLPIPGKRSGSGTTSPQHSAMSSGPRFDKESGDAEQGHTKTSHTAEILREVDHGKDRMAGLQMGYNMKGHNNTNTSVSTAVTLPRDKAIAYLGRTLAETKKFKQELYFRPEISESNRYPPLAVIYGKSIPTCCGAKVDGKEGIPCSDSYDNLAFASGDGVCLAKEAMLPENYKVVNGGRIRSDRGHVTLLGDLNAVGRAIDAVCKGRARGIGLGVSHKSLA